jgi:integrase
MASLQQRNGSYRVLFQYRGKQYAAPIGKVSAEEAAAKVAQVDYLLLRLRQGLIELPAAIDIVEFIRHDGKPPTREAKAAPRLTLAAFISRYLDTHRESLEANTLATTELHFKHLKRILGLGFPIHELELADLQRYADQRAKEKHKGRRISPTTIKKEIVTLRTAWNWGVAMKLVAGRYPSKGVRFAKTDEKPPFQTREQIERQIPGIKPEAIKELWNALYLQVHEIADLLALVKENAAYPWIYPLACMAAHTGARRSELARMLVTDVDFKEGAVTIREKKRVKGQRSTRRAPLTPTLRQALEEWLVVHPGGQALFCHDGEVFRSKKRSRTTGHQNGPARATSLKGRMATVKLREERPGHGPLTAGEIHDHLKRTLRDTRWNVMRGLHVLRHSCVSCLAAAGVDQRIIDDIVGHCSEAMRRRYRHLTPQAKSQAVASVFG